MRKFVAILCAVAMTLTMGTNALARISISAAGIQEAVVSPETAARIPEGFRIEIHEDFDEAELALIKDQRVVEVITKINKLNGVTETISMADIIDILELELSEDGTVKTESGKEINPLEYEPIVKFVDLDLVNEATEEATYGDDLAVPEDVGHLGDPDDPGIEITLTMEALKDTVAEDLLFMQLNPDTGYAAFIDIDPERFDPETGKVTVTFPGFGPFTVLEKTA